MEIDLETRKVTLQELSDFIQSAQFVLDSTLQTLGWDESKLNSTMYKTCPYNPEHQVPEKSLQKHIQACKLRLEGYSNDEQFLPDAGSTADSYIKLDEKTRLDIIHKAVREIPGMRTMLWVVCLFSSYRCSAECDSHPVPQTSDRLLASTTPDERAAFHDYVVKKTNHRHSGDLPLELPFPDNNESRGAEPKSALEMKAQERDAKRRRVNYKKVHTSRKSHTEILREVIQNQMELLENCVQSEQ